MTGPTNEIALDDLASKIRSEHDAVQRAVETATGHAIRCGQLLTEAKDGLAHGQWLPWLQEHCEVSERTAQAYMRLALKHGALDTEKAQRVADLPVREAMKAIADERAGNLMPPSPGSFEDGWAWAERQVNGPFNKFDFDNWDLGRTKLLRQVGVSSIAAFCTETATKEFPMLRLVSCEELHDALRRLVPVAKGGLADLDIDFDDLAEDAAYFLPTLQIDAQRAVGGLLNELEYRKKTYGRMAPEEYADVYGRDSEKVRSAFLADCDRKLAESREQHGAA